MGQAQSTIEERWNRMIAHGEVACMTCGYSLRGLEGDICPECGVPIDRVALMYVGEESLSVGGVVQRTGVPGAVAAATALHLAGMLIAPTVYLAVVGRGGPPGVFANLDLLVMVGLGAVAVVAACAHRFGADWSAWTDDSQGKRAVAWIAWGLTAAKAALLLVIGVLRMIG